MDFIIQDNPEESRFEVYHVAARVGFVQCRLTPDQISLTHTETVPAARRQGVVSRLSRVGGDDRGNRAVTPC
jgi:ribosomal protein S18 acetylase RimI-like enzyme